MPTNEVLWRLSRIYTSIDATLEDDLGQFPPDVSQAENYFAFFQDFAGGLSPTEISNLAHSMIHNIVNLRDHLRKWAAKNGHDKALVDKTLSGSLPLQVITDLSNNDKHDYPPRNSGFSKKALKLIDVERVLRLTTRAEPGSGVGMVFTLAGPKQVSGSGSAAVTITGQVSDRNGNSLGDLYELCAEALEAWERLLRDFRIVV